MPARTASSSLLLLADGRLPCGAHAHSGGVEPVAGLLGPGGAGGVGGASGPGSAGDLGGVVGVGGIDDVRRFLAGRLRTAGLLAAALAAAAATVGSSPVALDVEADARMPSPASREASRKQGRQLLRAARTVWPSSAYDDLPDRPHQPLVLGVAARVAGLGPGDAALAAAHGSVTGAASAAVRLLSLDPIAVHRLLAELGPDVDAVAVAATVAAERGEIPAPAAPLLEIAAEDHATWEVRLFAS